MATREEPHPQLKAFVDAAIKVQKNNTRNLEREIEHAQAGVKDSFRRLVAAEMARSASGKRREERLNSLASELENLNKLDILADFELSTDGEPVIVLNTKPLVGFLPRGDGESDEVILGEFEFTIYLSGTYPGMVVKNKTRTVDGAPAPNVSSDGRILAANWDIALPTLLGEQRYVQIVQRAIQVLARVPEETPHHILEAWRKATRRRS